MWHLQLDELFKNFFTFSKRQQFFAQLCLIVFVVHLFVLFVFTALSYAFSSHQKFIVSSQNKSSLYVLSPLHKHIEQKKSDKIARKRSMSASKVIELQAFLEELKKPKVEPTQKIEQEEQPVLEIVKAQDTTESKDAKVDSLKKKKKPLAKTQLSTKKALVKKQEVKSVIEKPKEQDKAIQKQVEDKPVEHVVKKETETAEKDAQKTDLDLDDATFIGYEDLTKLATQEHITRIVQQHFKPPVGMAADVSVELRVQIGYKGKVDKVDVMRSSGIVVYDSSARAALYKANLPQEVWNKTITIVLGQ